MITMLISGALCGLMATNNVMGEAERLVLNATEGAGFIGIAVALMGPQPPVWGISGGDPLWVPLSGRRGAGALDQYPSELIVVIQALVILFTGALDNMVRMPIEKIFLAFRKENA